MAAPPAQATTTQDPLDSATVLRESETLCTELGQKVETQGKLRQRQQALAAAIGEVSTSLLRVSGTAKAELEARIATRLEEEQNLGRQRAPMWNFRRSLWGAICPAWLRRLLGRSEPLR
jgi:hypothetical protein